MTDMDRETRDDIIEIINEVEAEVLAEDKLGASRDQIAEGTCERIRERIYSVGTGTDQEVDV